MESAALKAYEILKSHNFSAEEAEIIVTAKDESLLKWVASKEDIASVRAELKEDIADLRAELKENIANVREDMTRLETRLVQWFVGTSVALTSIVFAIAKLAS